MDPGEPSGAEVDPVGGVYWIPDRWWGFLGTRTEDHPGACVEAAADAALLQGTSQRPAHAFRQRYVRVDPDDHNGLAVTTHFALLPRRFSIHRLASLHKDPARRAGQLSAGDLERLRRAMHRILGAAS
jgi:hypothetical protein